MQFTPQQLVGGSRYSTSVRIGNWSEDLELDDLKLKDYLSLKESGNLKVNTKQKKLEASLAPTQLGPSSATSSTSLTFGTALMLGNHKSEAFLSGNPFDKTKNNAFSCTSSKNAAPCSRNTVILERCSIKDGFGEDDNEVHYGQDIKLRMCAFSTVEDSYLFSHMLTPLSSSKMSTNQEVLWSYVDNGNTKWQFQHPDCKQRFESEGEIIKISNPVCLKHVPTGKLLASDKIQQDNLFGNEYEVHCKNYLSTNKTQNLFSESKGLITGDYPLRRTGLENVWTLVTGGGGSGSGEEVVGA